MKVRQYIPGQQEQHRKGKAPTYRHFDHTKDKPYYKLGDKWVSAVDDLAARGFVLPDGTFLPHDWNDLLMYEEARRLCRSHGITLHKPTHPRNGRLTPPPLLTLKGTIRSFPVWNRSTILRHIDQKKKEQNA